jgi:dTDP-4-dehydrorhamnose 3,5-epimerase
MTMKIDRCEIEGLLTLTPIKREDERGFFSEVYRRDILIAHGLRADFVQENHVYSRNRGVLRGLHFQIPPHAQGKLVRCIKGSILDVAVDIRTDSPTFGKHIAVELSETNWKQLWVPWGFAHGYVTLETNSEVIYVVTDHWAAAYERGLAWDDPALGIEWRIPSNELTVSDKDRNNPLLSDLEDVFQFSRTIHT